MSRLTHEEWVGERIDDIAVDLGAMRSVLEEVRDALVRIAGVFATTSEPPPDAPEEEKPT